jgi:hypothetical protein
VHAVNERLRASRRKLGVSSSREAARLLAKAEQENPNSLVDKPLGIARGAAESPRSVRRGEGRASWTAAAIRGTLVMSLVLAAVLLSWVSPGNVGPDRPPKWRTVTSVPTGPDVVRNDIRLDGSRLLWNGDAITEAMLQQYLDVTTFMSPQPMVVLSYSAQTRPSGWRPRGN